MDLRHAFTNVFSSKTMQACLLGVMLGLSGMVSAQGISQDDPMQMVSAISNQVVSEMNAKREQYEQDPTLVKTFANSYVLPYVDTRKMARYILARNWKTATKEQQEGFVDAFTNTMIRSYSQSLLKLKVESVDVKPAKQEKPGRVSVASVVTQADGNKSKVTYRAFQSKKTKKWMVYDVTIEGISMLLNYRKSYASEISKKGLDAVIAEMQSKNAVFNGKSNG